MTGPRAVRCEKWKSPVCPLGAPAESYKPKDRSPLLSGSGDHPATTENEAGPERGKEYREALLGRLRRGVVQSCV